MLGIFLDSETNGLCPFTHRLLEVAFKVVNLLSKEEVCSYNAIVRQPEAIWQKSDLESLAVNGFTWEKCLQGKPETIVKTQIINLFHKHHLVQKKALFICQNPSFDRIFLSQLIDPKLQNELNWPYHWLDLASMYWAVLLRQNHQPYEKSLSKDAIAEHYGLPPEAKPHAAMGGVDHLLLCYEAVVGFPQINLNH